MRRVFLIVATFAVLMAGFLIYLGFQPRFADTAKTSLDGSPIGPGRMAADGSLMGPGTGAWVKQYNRQGRLEYQFRSDVYDPRSDGMVYVTRPVIQFFMGDGQILNVEGEDGIVSKPPGADRDSLAGAPVDAPRYGNLRHVTVKIFPSAAALAGGEQNMTITMTNGEFDNDTFRLFTQEYTQADGHVVHKDEVPITVRSKDYAFDGSGLVMYWNDLDKRLKSLDIAHGRQLTIYNASAFSMGPQATPPPAGSSSQPSAPSPPPMSSGPVALAAAAPPPPGEPSPPATAPTSLPQTPAQSRQRYLATFTDDVRVVQNGKELVHANWMGVDFALKSQSEEPATQPAETAIASTPSSAPSWPAPPRSAVATNSPTPAIPTTAPTATGPAEQPMLVFWKGPLHIAPTDMTDAVPLEEGKSIVHLVGTPVTVHQPANQQQQATDVQCTDLFYRTADSGGTLLGSTQFPLMIKQWRQSGAPSVITGESAEFSRLNRLATIQGAGEAKLPDPNAPKSVLDAHWGQSCKVHLADSAAGQMEIEAADLSGNVVVNHPRFDLASRQLTLRFDPSAAQAGSEKQQQLRQVVAQGDASCTVHDPNQAPRHIVGQRLEVRTDRDEDGQLFAKTVLADDGVKADQDQQELRADHLRIALLPKPQTANDNGDMSTDAQLQQLIATGDVHVSGKDSASAQGDYLQLDKVEGHSRITIRGSPAQVANRDSTLVGPEIHVWPDQKISSVIGPGTLDTSQQPADPAAKPRPMHVTWEQTATLDGKTNQVLIVGDVVASSQPPGGPTDLAQGGRLLLHLADAPKATQASDQSPASRPDDIGGADFSFMRNKQVQSFSFLEKAQMDSTLADDKGNKLRELNLRGERIDYDNTNQKLSVPGAGIMLTYDHQVAATQPSSFGGQGTTRFDWQTRFIFDQSGRTATIEGNVVIIHRDEGANARQVRLDAPLVRAQFEPQGTTRPAQAQEEASMQLRQMTASGGVTVNTGDKTITAGDVQYDAAHDQLICRAGEQGTVHLIDQLHPAGFNADEIWLNVKANTIEKIVNLSGRAR